ncbi:ADP-dependent glucokinase [Ischnura elegans]|uniref:ADP-dependent glucokinase n=1 Tax=Ischnura elegans TaxID=197161 RepID=UPI001ED89D5D|nr:ADP-dependent glucokinase [Ischnura elegans]
MALNFLNVIISVVVVVIALIYYKNVEVPPSDRLSDVLVGLIHLEKEYPLLLKPKVAIGYGACKDLFVDGKNLLLFSSAANEPEHIDDINNRDELLKTYAYFFRHGAAAERYMSNSTFFDETVEIASKIPGAYYALGGNAPVMASRFFREGCDVLLAAKMTQELQKSLPNGMKVVGGEVASDDIHLIMEYKAGEKWGPYVSPRANRFIVHNDDNNPLASSLESFGSVLENFSPNLLVVSGLQMMDNYPFKPGAREERLAKIRDQMLSVSEDTRVHFEMASFSEFDLMKQLVEYIVPYADSLGMNEQELPNLCNLLLHGKLTLVSDTNPRVATVLDQMREVFRILSAHEGNGRQLTRLHVHTLAYQAIMTVHGSPWKLSEAAAAKASLTAHRHVCGSPEVDLSKSSLIMDDSFATSVASGSRRINFDNNKPVTCWQEELSLRKEGSDSKTAVVEVCIAPVLVCTKAKHTAGAGDNISSAGLVLQI